MSVQTRLGTRPLHEHFGVEVIGFDFSAAVTPELAREILDLADRHFLLLFRGQRVTEAQHVAFSAALGPIIPPVERAFASATNPMLLRLGNVDMDGNQLPADSAVTKYNDAAEPWHSDGSFKPEPNYLTVLHALEVPPVRGDTGFVSMVAAYEALPAATKAALAGRRMTHPYPNRSLKVKDWKGVDLDVVAHPVVREIPGGRRSLFLANPFSDGRILDLAPEESERLVKELLGFATSGPFTYIHRWRLGDTLMWNNRGLVHSAQGWDRVRHRRLLQRSEVSAAHPHLKPH